MYILVLRTRCTFGASLFVSRVATYLFTVYYYYYFTVYYYYYYIYCY